jgi:hypothetical protein
MTTSRVGLLHWQFDLTWVLFEYHLDRLADDDTLTISTARPRSPGRETRR